MLGQLPSSSCSEWHKIRKVHVFQAVCSVRLLTMKVGWVASGHHFCHPALLHNGCGTCMLHACTCVHTCTHVHTHNDTKRAHTQEHTCDTHTPGPRAHIVCMHRLHRHKCARVRAAPCNSAHQPKAASRLQHMSWSTTVGAYVQHAERGLACTAGLGATCKRPPQAVCLACRVYRGQAQCHPHGIRAEARHVAAGL